MPSTASATDAAPTSIEAEVALQFGDRDRELPCDVFGIWVISRLFG